MTEKDYIEKLISENLEGLNDNDPNEGHFERFEEKLIKQSKKRTISLRFVLKIAAAIIFVFLAVNQGLIYFSAHNSNSGLKNDGKEFSLASVSPEYEEVEFYYSNAINIGLNQWENMIGKGLISKEEQNMMDEELSDFGNIYESVRKDLEANPTDERVINAMIEYYRTKLGVINMIVNKLEEVKQKNDTKDETEM